MSKTLTAASLAWGMCGWCLFLFARSCWCTLVCVLGSSCSYNGSDGGSGCSVSKAFDLFSSKRVMSECLAKMKRYEHIFFSRKVGKSLQI